LAVEVARQGEVSVRTESLGGRGVTGALTDMEMGRVPRPAFPCDHDIDLQPELLPSDRCRKEGSYFAPDRSPHTKC
jgi:hypothetical protein